MLPPVKRIEPHMDSLHNQIDQTMRRAFGDLIEQSLARRSTDDVAWLRDVCIELRGRMNALTPHRLDLHRALDAEFDVDLLMQMVRHDAADTDDLKRIGEVVCRRLALLCAPVQDHDVESLRRVMEQRPTFGELLMGAHRIIDETERLGCTWQSRKVAEGNPNCASL